MIIKMKAGVGRIKKQKWDTSRQTGRMDGDGGDGDDEGI